MTEIANDKGSRRRLGPESGTPIVSNEINADLFWSNVDKSGECWIWMRRTCQIGYGILSARIGGKKRPVNAHRAAYALAHGKLAAGVVVCHSCDNRRCVRPEHLFASTQADNMLDSFRKGRVPKNVIGGRCSAGHVLTPGNTAEYIGPRGRRRIRCLDCRRNTRSLRRGAA